MTQPTAGQVAAAIREVLHSMTGNGRPSMSYGLRTFPGKLLTVKVIEQFEPDLRELAISPSTIVTPLAKDLIKRRGIRLVWISEEARRQAAGLGEWGFAIDAVGGSSEILRKKWLVDSEPWQDLGSDVMTAASWVRAVEGRGAILLTDDAAVAVWLAIRIEGVRAVSPTTAQAVSRAVDRLGANLLIFEPRCHTTVEIESFARLFRRSGAPLIPESLAARASWIKGLRHENRGGAGPGDAVTIASEPSQWESLDRSPDDSRGPRIGFGTAGRGARRV